MVPVNIFPQTLNSSVDWIFSVEWEKVLIEKYAHNQEFSRISITKLQLWESSFDITELYMQL